MSELPFFKLGGFLRGEYLRSLVPVGLNDLVDFIFNGRDFLFGKIPIEAIITFRLLLFDRGAERSR
jgi:hypothetical protein